VHDGDRLRLLPDQYRALRRASPIIMLVGMAASGWLFLRGALRFGDDGEAQTFGADIPIMVTIAALWIAAMVALLRPPRAVRARTTRTVGAGSQVVWPLGRDMRIWNVVSAPFGGMLGSFFFLPAFLPESPSDDPNAGETSALPDAVVFVMVAVLAVGIVAQIWMISRSILHGVELTESEIIVHGYFRSHRYRRDAIAMAAGTKIPLVVSILFSLLRMDAEQTVLLTLHNGERHTLLASSSDGADYGADVINAWIARS
jgi:hypothetical protein